MIPHPSAEFLLSPINSDEWDSHRVVCIDEQPRLSSDDETCRASGTDDEEEDSLDLLMLSHTRLPRAVASSPSMSRMLLASGRTPPEPVLWPCLTGVSMFRAIRDSVSSVFEDPESAPATPTAAVQPALGKHHQLPQRVPSFHDQSVAMDESSDDGDAEDDEIFVADDTETFFDDPEAFNAGSLDTPHFRTYSTPPQHVASMLLPTAHYQHHPQLHYVASSCPLYQFG